MGLDINNYSASYSQIHRLRAWALKVAKKKFKLMCSDYGKMDGCGKCAYCRLSQVDTAKGWGKLVKFYEFINHSDCEGGYISLKKLGLKVVDAKKFKDNLWGDLDRLVVEVRELNKHKKELKNWNRTTWDSFYSDVMQAYKFGGILEFR